MLYKLGERRPEAIAPHAPVFLDLLQAKDNRMKWGAMSAVSAVAPLAKDLLAKNLARVVAAADAGSVITRDHAVRILAVLGADARHAKRATPALLDQVLAAPVNQLPMYAELALPAIGAAHRARFLEILHARMRAPLPPTKLKRLGAVLRKVERTT